LSEFMYYGMIG